MPQNDFSQILMSAVEESLSSLGDSPKQAIFYHLESHFKIKKESIPLNLTEFARALEKLFGPGASYLEQLITRRMYDKLGLNLEEQGSADFIDCVHKLKEHLSVEAERKR